MSQGVLQALLVGTLGVAGYLLFFDIQQQRHDDSYAACPAVPPPPQCRPKQKKKASCSQCRPCQRKDITISSDGPVKVSVKEKSKSREMTEFGPMHKTVHEVRVEVGSANKKHTKGKKRRKLYSGSQKNERSSQCQSKQPKVKNTTPYFNESETNATTVEERIKFLRMRLFIQKTKYGKLGWFERDCDFFYVSASRMSWNAAKEHCSLLMSDLVSDQFATEENYRFLQTNVFPNYQNASLWSGLYYRDNAWRWNNATTEERNHLIPAEDLSSEGQNRSACGIVTKQFPNLLEARDCNETRHRAFCHTGPSGFEFVKQITT